MTNRDIDPEAFDDSDSTEALSERKLSPYRKKQLDYKRQSRFLSSGNRGYRRASKLLPHLERRSYRRALDTATHAAELDSEAELTSADNLKSIKRSQFKQLVERKAVRLREAVQIKKAKRQARANHPPAKE